MAIVSRSRTLTAITILFGLARRSRVYRDVKGQTFGGMEEARKIGVYALATNEALQASRRGQNRVEPKSKDYDRLVALSRLSFG